MLLLTRPLDPSQRQAIEDAEDEFLDLWSSIEQAGVAQTEAKLKILSRRRKAAFDGKAGDTAEGGVELTVREVDLQVSPWWIFSIRICADMC